MCAARVVRGRTRISLVLVVGAIIVHPLVHVDGGSREAPGYGHVAAVAVFRRGGPRPGRVALQQRRLLPCVIVTRHLASCEAPRRRLYDSRNDMCS